MILGCLIGLFIVILVGFVYNLNKKEIDALFIIENIK
jgi:hypothetical protein